MVRSLAQPSAPLKRRPWLPSRPGPFQPQQRRPTLPGPPLLAPAYAAGLPPSLPTHRRPRSASERAPPCNPPRTAAGPTHAFRNPCRLWRSCPHRAPPRAPIAGRRPVRAFSGVRTCSTVAPLWLTAAPKPPGSPTRARSPVCKRFRCSLRGGFLTVACGQVLGVGPSASPTAALPGLDHLAP